MRRCNKGKFFLVLLLLNFGLVQKNPSPLKHLVDFAVFHELPHAYSRSVVGEEKWKQDTTAKSEFQTR